jgi:hypothetical protein
MLESIKQKVDEVESGTGIRGRARQAGTVISVVIIGVVALVGTLIFGEVYSAMDFSTMPTQLNTTADTITSGFGDAIGLVPIVLLVLLASVVIAVVQRMR